MTDLLHQLMYTSASRMPENEALRFRGNTLTYFQLNTACTHAAKSLIALGLGKQERVAVYLPKQFETVIAFFAAAQAGGVFVPVNPILKSEQVSHILQNCNARILVTSEQRLGALVDDLKHCPDLHTIVCLNTATPNLGQTPQPQIQLISWDQFIALADDSRTLHRVIDTDMASILYTSGSTGKPKGVVLSHRNMVAGAKSVAQYLENHSQDRILAVLPFSFDYGFSQLTTAFHTGACAVLMDYLLPRDVIKAADRENITGLAAVPPLWVQLAQLEWPSTVVENLRYITNSGGAMPLKVISTLRAKLPKTQVYLMYGLTEAFRSSYLPPSQIDKRPESMGKAIPNAELMVVREDGTPCSANEPGELVHRGSLVALGYWNDPEKTAERFKLTPNRPGEIPIKEIAVWSGDTVRMDEEGYLYFIGRKDDMIKTSGYRVSPTEVEEVIYATGLVKEAAALGIAHPTIGQGILVAVTNNDNQAVNIDAIIAACKQHLPNFMVPQHIDVIEDMPKNPNGKIDRKNLSAQYANFFDAN